MNRLNAATLEQLPAHVVRPGYDRTQIKPGIVHLGIGAFHRAHQAWYTENVLASRGGDWGIIGCSLRSAGVRDQLEPQDGLYTLVEKDNDAEKLQVLGAVLGLRVGPDDPRGLVALMADPAIKVVSLTVTEKGYCHDPASGDLNVRHPDIQHDLKNLATPRSAPGYIIAALEKRMRAGEKPFTPLSCDNLPNNGWVLSKVILQFARLYDHKLADWIEAEVTFPCTMIDRIVPATTNEDRAALEAKLGLRDEGMVVAEPFSQWVIEDKFCNDRPAWEDAGALLVSDVEVYEHMKLRLLNGSHSTLAYCGYLSGFETISDVMAEPAFVNLCTIFMDREAGETLVEPEGFDIACYKQQLRDRFANRGLKHRTWQIAMDGSQKLPQRLLMTLRDQLQGAGNIDIICAAVAAWIRYVSGVDEKGQPIDVRDPLAERLRKLCDRNHGDAAATVNAVLSVSEVFGRGLQEEEKFVSGVTRWLESYYSDGVLASIRKAFG